jgi:hypothetical protein
MHEQTQSPQEKALAINLDARRFGTFAEIGAGQEVARWFFHAGKASSTIAESISAYDMAISNAIYGPTEHYVSRARLTAMLDREYDQLVNRLGPTKGDSAALFVFADTVATNTSSRLHAGHGWLGVRFQDQPKALFSDAIIHIEMLDIQTVGQQEAVGVIGVNLLYGAFYHAHDPPALIASLMDNLNRRRMEVDMIKLSGPAFEGVDNRLMSLQLVERALTDAAMFEAGGDVVQPSEVLYNKPVLIERGSFRPVTNVTLNMLDHALTQLRQDAKAPAEEPVVLMEMTLRNLMTGGSVDHQDFLARVEILGALNRMVMISNYSRFDQVTSYLRHYTRNWIAMVVGVPTLRAIFDEKYYADLAGGILEGLGQLFSGAVKLFVYPTVDATGGALATADTVQVDPRLKHLYAHLFENGFIEPIREFDVEELHVSPGEVLQKIQTGDPSWQSLVPPHAASRILEKGLFGLRKPA